ncbi:MAG: glycerophosphoryl diester phosphodiesterase membrane domain-containing protein [Micropruina sp.]|uniref:DUF7847 domain-containing protein n=1 Tax=Micropruina sp. TaxID=2737536 RepID=UPI0039E677F7
MTNPTPLLRPSPMDISGLFSSSFEALKRRFGLFILLSLTPSLLMLAVFLSAALIGGSAALTRNQSAIVTALIVVAAIVAVGGLIIMLAQLKMYGMMTQGAYEIAQGQRPDFKGLLVRTAGFLPRLVPVIAIFAGIVIAIYLVLIALLWTVFGSLSSQDASAAVAGFFGVMLLLIFVGIPLSIVLWTRLLYLVPAVVIEQRSGMDALRRSWRLTKGCFWRTFGYAIVPQLAVSMVMWVLSTFTQFAGGLMGGVTPQNPSPAEALAYLLGLIPLLTVSTVLQLIVQLFTSPFIQTYYTYMFIDQVRRDEMPQYRPGTSGYSQGGYGASGPHQPGYGQPPHPDQPGAGTSYPGQPYPGPLPEYPPQQYPPQAGEPGPSQNQWPGQR